MRVDRIPPWPAHHLGRLLEYSPAGETEHHTLGLQYYQVPTLSPEGHVLKWTKHDYDIVKPKLSAPASLAKDEDWERVFEEPEEVGGLKYRRVVRVRYRHKRTGAVASREMVLWQPGIFPGGAITRPQIQYPDGSRALLYLEQWRPGQNKVIIGFPDGMLERLPNGQAETPIGAALRELEEEGGIKAGSGVNITILDQWQKPSFGLSGTGQQRHFFRVLVHGLEKDFVPEPKPEEDELIKIKIVPIDRELKHHFDRYTEGNGYLVTDEFKEELDYIISTLP